MTTFWQRSIVLRNRLCLITSNWLAEDNGFVIRLSGRRFSLLFHTYTTFLQLLSISHRLFPYRAFRGIRLRDFALVIAETTRKQKKTNELYALETMDWKSPSRTTNYPLFHSHSFSLLSFSSPLFLSLHNSLLVISLFCEAWNGRSELGVEGERPNGGKSSTNYSGREEKLWEWGRRNNKGWEENELRTELEQEMVGCASVPKNEWTKIFLTMREKLKLSLKSRDKKKRTLTLSSTDVAGTAEWVRVKISNSKILEWLKFRIWK